MYVCTFEEFILVGIWIHYCRMNGRMNEWSDWEECYLIYTHNKGLRNVRIALRSQLTSES